MPEIKVLRRAEQDAAEIHDWYESEGVGLGLRFLSRLEECFQAITHNPFRFAVERGRYRRAVVKKISYSVYYTFSAETVIVHAVVHNARDQDVILRELP